MRKTVIIIGLLVSVGSAPMFVYGASSSAASACSGVRSDAITTCQSLYDQCTSNHPGQPNTNDCAEDSQQVATGQAAYNACLGYNGTSDACTQLLAPASMNEYLSTFSTACDSGQTWSSTGGQLGNGGCIAQPAPTTPTVTPSNSTGGNTGTSGLNCDSNGNCTYTPLEPLPILNGYQNGTSNVPVLLNGILKILVIAGALSAVAMLVFAGIQYMVSDVVTKKIVSKERIRNALWGLLLLLGAWLILYTINPQLLNFSNIFCPTSGIPGGGCSSGGVGTSQTSQSPGSTLPANIQQMLEACYQKGGYIDASNNNNCVVAPT
jgi:hypothetical protein